MILELACWASWSQKSKRNRLWNEIVFVTEEGEFVHKSMGRLINTMAFLAVEIAENEKKAGTKKQDDTLEPACE